MKLLLLIGLPVVGYMIAGWIGLIVGIGLAAYTPGLD